MERNLDASQTAASAGSSTETQLRLLVETGLRLASEPSLDAIVQQALDAGLQLCGAAFGAFFYNRTADSGETYQLYKLTGAAEEAFRGFPLPRPTEIFAHTFVDKKILRSDDIRMDPRYGRNQPLSGTPPRHIPVASYLAVPVKSRAGEVLGAMFYGHPEPGMIPAGSEDLVATLASQAAAAIENVTLTETLQREMAAADSARQQQRETLSRLAEVLESTTDGVILLDRDFRVTFINTFARKLMAQGRDATGESLWTLVPEARGTVFEQRYNEAMFERKPAEFTELYEPLNLWTYVRTFPTPEGIAIFFQNVTRQKLAERQAAETTQRLRQALEAGRLGTWTWNRQTDFLDYDERAAEIWGVEAHVPISRTELRQRMVHPDDLALTPKNLHEVLEREGKYESEYRIMTPHGARWIATTAIASRREGTNELIGMSGTFQDITERKTQEATLRQSEKLAATGRLAATIAHEINNPLEAVTNLIFLCKTDPAVPTAAQRLLETADGELARVAQIAQQTLGFYRDTARPAEIDMAALLSSVVDLFSRKLLSKKMACTLDIARDLRIIGLQGELKQVFSNLLVNAIDASESNTTIRIRGKNSACGGKHGVSVVMADQGKGIPLHVRERLFSPFFTTKETVGTGLGLWVTRGIVEKQGGTIRFRTCTDTPSGTVFRVFLPAETGHVESFGSPLPRFIQ